MADGTPQHGQQQLERRRLNPPEGAVVLSIDEKTAIAARARRYPGRPAAPGAIARQEFEYRRHGTASLIAALDVTSGEVLT
ncbi:hypothetical protein ACFYNW_32695, partial [Streptomyces virginiae]